MDKIKIIPQQIPPEVMEILKQQRIILESNATLIKALMHPPLVITDPSDALQNLKNGLGR